MPKRIDSPVKRWPGYVVLHDPLTWNEYSAWTRAIEEAQEFRQNDRTNGDALDALLIPGICACVSEWHLDGLPDKVSLTNYPFTPRKSASTLTAWLVREITALIVEADEIPNES